MAVREIMKMDVSAVFGGGTEINSNEEIPQRNHQRRVSSLNKSLVKSRRPVSHHRNLGKNDWSSARPNGVRQESANQLSNVRSDKSRKVHQIPIDLKVSHVHFDFYRLVIVTFISAVLFVSSVVFCVCANLSFLFPYPSFFFLSSPIFISQDVLYSSSINL